MNGRLAVFNVCEMLEEGSLHTSITGIDDVLDRYAFGMLCNYINPEIVSLAKDHHVAVSLLASCQLGGNQ
ncbi:unnamed protein product [Heligmosomoides polygyrus]|uniref:Calponin-homology (CH) domain-containing protein n=1 Tax=Heligmosomoides polygyrus TaxID=6339 RepID=A0A183FN28_HELPZ|nr:unnamed protein product [Heligmosomoides polygyrus]